jgi:dienelactone hydrolase
VRLAGGVAALAAALLVSLGAGTAAGAPTCRLEGPLGTGAAQSWILRPAGRPRSIVVYAHGWTATDPNDWHRRELDHLCSRGSVVVFPRYQRDALDTFESTVEPFRQGLQAAFRRLGPARVPVVAAGYSFGGALVFYYAANARAWKLPVPAAVYSIFPVEPLALRKLPPFPRSTRVLVLAGDQDEVVGTAGAQGFLRYLRAHGRKEYRRIRSTPGLRAHHEAPKETTPLALRTFWAPLDGLVAGARTG